MRQVCFLTTLVVATVSVGMVMGDDDGSDSVPADQIPVGYERLDRFVRHWSDQAQGRLGQWMFEFEGTPIMVLADEQHNRMRIISPVADADPLEPQILRQMLEANFDRALDARYAIWKDQIWSVYLHPLTQLTEDQFHRGVEQVIQLRKNFGTTFSSSAIIFGNGE